MKRLNLFLLFLCSMIAACSEPNTEIDNGVDRKTKEVRFKASIVQSIRNNGSAFEKGDVISVFAVEPSANISFDAVGNYADNVKYLYSASTLFLL